MPTNDEKSRFVSEKLGMVLETKCECGDSYLMHRHGEARGEGVRCANFECNCYGYVEAPPDLTSPAGADALMTALLKQQVGVHIHQGEYVRVGLVNDDSWAYKRADNWREALLDAAYCSLKERFEARNHDAK